MLGGKRGSDYIVTLVLYISQNKQQSSLDALLEKGIEADRSLVNASAQMQL